MRVLGPEDASCFETNIGVGMVEYWLQGESWACYHMSLRVSFFVCLRSKRVALEFQIGFVWAAIRIGSIDADGLSQLTQVHVVVWP